MADDPGPTAQPKSLADILAQELDGKIGAALTQELPLEEKQERLRVIYNRIHAEEPERGPALRTVNGKAWPVLALRESFGNAYLSGVDPIPSSNADERA